MAVPHSSATRKQLASSSAKRMHKQNVQKVVCCCTATVALQCAVSSVWTHSHLHAQVGEVDRARAIYVHASSLSDPRNDPGFWKDWNDFEVHRRSRAENRLYHCWAALYPT